MKYEMSFQSSLATAQSWCARGEETSESVQALRSLASPATAAPTQSSVESIVAERRRRIAVTSQTFEGRLLAYYPELSLSDGAAENASHGFFDVNDAPPCDTWVSFEDGSSDRPARVIAWVPQAFEKLAADGIRVCVDGAIEWLRDEKEE